ncbi:TPA: hypothetical protein HA361_04715 [Candidatus Woesearchaeota archaeon]|nr:hypothetical protein [Candidatus Woesearchaeota archaeon]
MASYASVFSDYTSPGQNSPYLYHFIFFIVILVLMALIFNKWFSKIQSESLKKQAVMPIFTSSIIALVGTLALQVFTITTTRGSDIFGDSGQVYFLNMKIVPLLHVLVLVSAFLIAIIKNQTVKKTDEMKTAYFRILSFFAIFTVLSVISYIIFFAWGFVW